MTLNGRNRGTKGSKVTWWCRHVLVLFFQAGEELVSLHHPRSKEVKRSAATLKLHWEELKKAVATRGKALEDNRDFLEFLQKVEAVEAWIRQKVGEGRRG